MFASKNSVSKSDINDDLLQQVKISRSTLFIIDFSFVKCTHGFPSTTPWIMQANIQFGGDTFAFENVRLEPMEREFQVKGVKTVTVTTANANSNITFSITRKKTATEAPEQVGTHTCNITKFTQNAGTFSEGEIFVPLETKLTGLTEEPEFKLKYVVTYKK